MYVGLHVKYRYCCQILIKLELCRQIFEKYINIKFQDNTSGGSRFVPRGRTGRPKLKVAFRNFANTPNNGYYIMQCNMVAAGSQWNRQSACTTSWQTNILFNTHFVHLWSKTAHKLILFTYNRVGYKGLWTELTGSRGRRRKQLMDDLKERRRYCKLKEEELDRTVWRTRCARGCGPVVR